MCAVGDRHQPGALTATAIAAGCGSTEQRRLFGLLCSVLKRTSTLGPGQQTYAEECRLAVATAAARFAQLYVAEASGSNAAGSNGAVGDLAPWLVLFGRCCLQWAMQLQWRLKGIAGLPRTAAVSQAAVFNDSFMDQLHIISSSDVFFTSIDTNSSSGGYFTYTPSIPFIDKRRVDAQPLMSLLLAAVQAPLQDAGTSAQLSALGVDVTSLLAKVASAKSAVEAGSVRQPDAVLEATKDLGEALCGLPFSRACNHAACGNMSGPSEAQLVQGASHKCSGCHTARYCGKECQVQDWEQHKPACKALAPAAAGAAGKRRAGAAAVCAS